VVAAGAFALQQNDGESLALAPGEQIVQVAERPASDVGVLLQSQQFIFEDSTAQSVALVGQFNDWRSDATPLVFDSTTGAWSVTVLLAPGRYEYQFLVDGSRHVADPTAATAASDFGASPNSVVTIRAQER
jgi:1,4-alpha-glucan branching enzyme